jgi:poly(3-hydroxyalkanoate) synthetase
MRKRMAENSARRHDEVQVRREARGSATSQSQLSIPFLWPLAVAATASEVAATFLNEFSHMLMADTEQVPAAELNWSTRNRILLDLQTMRLREFSRERRRTPILICAPFALHRATIGDFAPGHSLVEALQNHGLRSISMTEWKSATPEMRFFSIDSYLADLNVAVDELGAPVDLIGLCQGGWMALVYAARFPAKVRRIVLVGAPIDIQAGESSLSRIVDNMPLAAFQEVVSVGEGRVLGQRVLALWAPALASEDVSKVLQLGSDLSASKRMAIERRFADWYASTVDLPGTYYLQVVTWLFKENRIAEGRFEALGRRVDLASVGTPAFLLAARDDELVSARQLFATADRIGTPRDAIEMSTEPGGHLSLFLGAETLRSTWSKIAHWLKQDIGH